MEKIIIKDFEPSYILDAEKILKEESPAGLLNWLSMITKNNADALKNLGGK